jgi:hypothetical protein
VRILLAKCEHCGGERLNGNGTQSGKQRYYYGDYRRTFQEEKDNGIKPIVRRC